jgi:hypothetical protein
MFQDEAMSSDQLSSNQLNLNLNHRLDSNSNSKSNSEQDQSQLDQQIEQNIEKTQSVKEISQTNQINVFLSETDTIDLSISRQKFHELFNRKRKTEEERQIALKKKYDLIKILTLVLSIDKALKNAQKTLFEGLKVAKTEHVIVQHLINQIE